MFVYNKSYSSWGGKSSSDSRGCAVSWTNETFPANAGKLLSYGMGRSYGDSCFLDRGCHLETQKLDRLIAFDPLHGVLRCEAGCSIASVLEFSIPRGWFVPVTPGTKFVTVGGCLANDVHGKNHHSAGTFGCFVNRFGLRRSDGRIYECSANENPGLFRATIGGLGLTGLVLWLELRLKKVASPFVCQRIQTLDGLESFFEVSRREDSNFEYSVAWLDASRSGKARGLFIAGNHVKEEERLPSYSSSPAFSVPFTFPDFALNTGSINLMNAGYYRANALRAGERTIFFDSFFYPLDAVGSWNRAYGKKGLVQYQFVVPLELGLKTLDEALGKMHAHQQTSFLTVVKLFGPLRSPGMLSFPRPGVTVCFDFPNMGEATLNLLTDLDRTVFESQGALYPAKDFRMSREAFEKSFPGHTEFRQFIDPVFSSNFARRTGLTP